MADTFIFDADLCKRWLRYGQDVKTLANKYAVDVQTVYNALNIDPKKRTNNREIQEAAMDLAILNAERMVSKQKKLKELTDK